MRFIITAQANPDSDTSAEAPMFDAELFKAYMRFNEDMHRAGVLVASEGLNPAAPGARIAVSRGKRYVVDGPFTESKELVGGFYLIEVDSLDEAIAELDGRVPWAGEIVASEWYRYRGLHDPEGNLVYLTEPLLDRR